MTQERAIHTDLRTMLMAGEPFEYAHLIKFERPSRPDNLSGKVSTSYQRYAYLTDASRDIGFDDGSKDYQGVSNGSQTYIANKVLKVSNVSEATEAKASTFSVTIDGNGLGAEIGPQTMNIVAVGDKQYDVEIVDKNVDPVYEGFREGDKITFTGDRSGDFNIVRFRSNNVVRIEKIDANLVEGSGAIGFKLSSEEVKSILLNKNDTDYASFINRDVFIYRIYQQDGATIGAPVLLFKGIISGVSFDDDDNGIVVNWSLTSHWGDFGQVKGRLTSDDFHRALDQNGIPQPQSTIKPIYAYDKGFMHAETSINLLSTYIVQVEQQKIKAKKGFFGIGAKVKVKKYLVPEDRHTDLDFQLAAKAIPVLYGVRNIVGTPVFADTLKSDSSEVYVIYALCEGPIGGIYDMYVDGKSLICRDASDLQARAQQTADNTVEVICRGRADRGDVLGSTVSTSPPAQAVNFYDNSDFRDAWGQLFNKNVLLNYQPYIEPTVEATANLSGRGVVGGESITLSEPIQMTLDFFSGTEGQKASSQLVQIAAAKNFKVQNDFWTGKDSAEYWSPNHRLIDTAYIVAKFKIKEGDTTIPDLEFIAKCKMLECYNYDYSYQKNPMVAGESAANFALGDIVTLESALGNVANATIIDKWTIVDHKGVTHTRFRWDKVANLGYTNGVPTVTTLVMRNASNQTWSMITFNHVFDSGTVPGELSSPVTSIDITDGYIGVNYNSNPLLTVGKDPSQPSPLFSIDNGHDIYVGTIGDTRLVSAKRVGQAL